MKRALIHSLILLALTLLVVAPSWAKPKTKGGGKPSKKTQHKLLGDPRSKYRGWDYLVGRLREEGVSEDDIASIYQSPRMPLFTAIPFKLKPKEHASLYANFERDFYAKIGASFIQDYDREFDKLERTYNVPREVVAAILVIETQLGKHTGKEMIVHRLSRLASVLDPENLKDNFNRLRAEDPTISLDDVKARGKYLEDTFLPEIPALIEIAKRNRVNVLNIQGSSAGAFGIPQFLPSACMKYGVDGDGDGHVSLYNEIDAIWSAGNYLAAFGYDPKLPYAERRKVIWEYNKSDAYIDAVFRVSNGIRELTS
jgi:membrane-bound lytic murein transglycosylase B